MKKSRGTTLKVLSQPRRGAVIVYVALALVVLLGAAGLSIDVGNLYLQRAKAQRAADAGALAGAINLLKGGDESTATAAAQTVAAQNGYDVNAGATVTGTLNPGGNNPGWFRVYVAKPEQLYFMAVFGMRQKVVGAPATATWEIPVNLDISGNGKYGANGPVNLSTFGPYAQHQYGDNYSPIYLQNNTPNPEYATVGRYGYDFNLTIPQNYAAKNGTNLVDLQIFDPDCYNNGGTDALSGKRIDEIRSPQSGNPKKATVDNTANYDHDATTTRYELFGPDDDVNPIATATYGGSDSQTDLTWVTPDGFQFDITNPRWASLFSATGTGSVNFRVNVKSINGSSENGFNLRAGPPLANVKEQVVTSNGNTTTQYQLAGTSKWLTTNPFNSNNGTNITATGHIPMNFNTSGTVTIHLGVVAANAQSVIIRKFDTDVGAKSITYTDGRNNYTGVLSDNDTFYTDTYNLPANYPGGDWYATYTAGLQDTSVWDMHYTGPAISSPGSVRLVR